MIAPIFPLPPDARRVLLVTNPMAGRGLGGEQVERLSRLLERSDFEPQIISDLDELSELVRQAVASKVLRAVVAAGGDGTAAEIVNRTPPGTPVALMPLGTENLLAKYIGQRPSPKAVAQTIDDGHAVSLDAGRADGRLFLLMISAGFDAEVVRVVHTARMGNISHWAYAKPIWQTIRTYQYPELRVICQNGSDESGRAAEPISARWVFGINLPRYARGLQLVPLAVGTDGRLDVCLFQRGSFWSGMRYLTGVATRQHLRFSDCAVHQCQRFRIEAEAPVPYQIDGDAAGWLPVDVEIVPWRTTLVVPHRFAQRHRRSMEEATGGL